MIIKRGMCHADHGTRLLSIKVVFLCYTGAHAFQTAGSDPLMMRRTAQTSFIVVAWYRGRS